MSSYLTNYKNVPSPVIPLTYTIVTLACYAAIYSYPNLGGVYAATILASSVSHAWFPCMWPWRLQTTSRATGSAFSIGFVNSLGQIGTVIGPQIFRSKFAPHYSQSFGIAMGFTGLCIIFTAVTWWMTRTTEKQTRQMRQLRIAAAKRGERLDSDADVDADADVTRKLG
jgi:nitrate/nitrite transporter NarK